MNYTHSDIAGVWKNVFITLLNENHIPEPGFCNLFIHIRCGVFLLFKSSTAPGIFSYLRYFRCVFVVPYEVELEHFSANWMEESYIYYTSSYTHCMCVLRWVGFIFNVSVRISFNNLMDKKREMKE